MNARDGNAGDAVERDRAAAWLASVGKRQGIPRLLSIIADLVMDRAEGLRIAEQHARELAAKVHAWALDATAERNTSVRMAALALFRAHGQTEIVHAFIDLTSAWSVGRRPEASELLRLTELVVRALGIQRVSELQPERFGTSTQE